MSEPELPPDLSELAGALGALRPVADLPGRDRLMFEAGRRSAKRSPLWPATSGLLAAGLLLSLLHRPTVNSDDSEFVQRPAATTAPAATSNYFRVRDAVLERGPDVLPASIAPSRPQEKITTPLDARKFSEEV